jgi:DtxR family Mn-dependent transcriptional regulator
MASITQAVEDYLKAVWRLSSRGRRVSVGEIAEHLSVSAPSVTGMVQKLQGMQLLRYAPRGGVSLTPRGRKIALEIVRHHRLWELYLYRRLGLPLEAVDAEAERLEHVLSDRMEERLASLLGDPTHDPHGDPIPSRDGVLAPLRAIPLAKLRAGRRAVVVRVSDRPSEKLRALVDLGLLPGARVQVLPETAGPRAILLRVGARRCVLPRELALSVQVREAPPAGGAARGSAPAAARARGARRRPR